MHNTELFSESFVNETSMLRRLRTGLLEACRDIRNDPRSYLSSLFERDGLGGRRRRALLKVGLATGVLVYGLLFFVTLISWKPAVTTLIAKEDKQGFISVIPNWVHLPKNKARESGGGGGGNENPNPASWGQEPQYLLRPPIMAPTTAPQLREPSLPFIESVFVDPRLEPKRDELAPTGIPEGVVGPPSDGPGLNKGIGTGKIGGVGPGEGPGIGPGRDGNKGGPGGPGAYVAERVDSVPILLNRPRPNYTEEAMRAKLEGTVRARVLVGADGVVKQVIISRHLALGLDDEAIRAAYQIRFKPATRNGVAVPFWIPLDIEFTLR